jgi:hypothetical protein
MSAADRRIERVPFLDLIDPGTEETEESPGIDDSGKPVIRPTEKVLFESKTFPSIRTVDGASGKARDTYVPGDGGFTLITDRRVIFMREKYDVGAFGKRSLNPVLRAASRTIASVRRGDTVAAGHIRFANVDSLSYKRERKLDAAVGVYVFTLTDSAGTSQVEVRARKAPEELRAQVVEAISVAHHVELPVPASQPGGWENWEYRRVRPSNPEDRYRDRPPSRLAEPPAAALEPPAPPAPWAPPSVG